MRCRCLWVWVMVGGLVAVLGCQGEPVLDTTVPERKMGLAQPGLDTFAHPENLPAAEEPNAGVRYLSTAAGNRLADRLHGGYKDIARAWQTAVEEQEFWAFDARYESVAVRPLSGNREQLTVKLLNDPEVDWWQMVFIIRIDRFQTGGEDGPPMIGATVWLLNRDGMVPAWIAQANIRDVALPSDANSQRLVDALLEVFTPMAERFKSFVTSGAAREAMARNEE